MKRLLIASLVTVFMTCMLPLAAHAAIFGGVCGDAGASTSATCSGKTSTDPLVGANGLIEKVTKIIALATGMIAVIIIIVSAIRYITSSGDSNSVSSAKSGIIYAAVGIVVIVLAQAIISFVVDRV